MGGVGEANRLWKMIGPERQSTRSPVPRSCRGLVWHVGRACKTGLGDRRCGAGAGVPCVAVAESHSGETLPILFCVLVLFCTTAILNVPGGPGLRGEGVPAYAVPLCRPLSSLGSGRPRGPPPAPAHDLPSFLVPRVRLLAHRVVLLCHANWISTTSFAGYSRIAALYRYLRLTYLFALYYRAVS